MLKDSSLINIASLQFNESCALVVDSLCEPLFNNFAISHFGCIRILENGQILRIANNANWTRAYFQHEFYNDLDMYSMKNVPMNEQRSMLLIGAPYNKHCKMLSSDFNLWNFMLIYERFPTYGDFWFFGTHCNNVQIANFYINNFNILQHFILYFKIKASHLFDLNDSSKLITTKIRPLEERAPNTSYINEFINKISHHKHYLSGRDHEKPLSTREAECLFHLSQGRTMKEIAELIHLSPRTIETHIDNIKNKMGCYTKGELISMFSTISCPFA